MTNAFGASNQSPLLWGLCVGRLNRGKTSTCHLDTSKCGRRGMECASDVSIQQRRICRTVIWIGGAQSTGLQLSIRPFLVRRWDVANARTTMQHILPDRTFCTVLAIWCRFMIGSFFVVSNGRRCVCFRGRDLNMLLFFHWDCKLLH